MKLYISCCLWFLLHFVFHYHTMCYMYISKWKINNICSVWYTLYIYQSEIEQFLHMQMHIKNEKQKSILDATFSHELIKSLKMSFTTIKFHNKYTVRITKWRGRKKIKAKSRVSHIMMNSKIPNINYIQYTHIQPNTNINYLMTWRECIYFLRLSVTFYLYVKCILYTNLTIYTVDRCERSSNQIHITYTIHWITHSAFSSFIT